MTFCELFENHFEKKIFLCMKSMLTEFMLDFGNVCLILTEVQPGLISKNVF